MFKSILTNKFWLFAIACIIGLSVFVLSLTTTPSKASPRDDAVVANPDVTATSPVSVATNSAAAPTFGSVFAASPAQPTPGSASTTPHASTSLVLHNQPVKNNKGAPVEKPSLLQHFELEGLPVAAYIPANVSAQSSVQVVLALHGMYGNGGVFCQGLLTFAQKNHVMVVAPTFNYNPDYKSTQIIKTEDVEYTAKLNQILGDLTSITHAHLNKQVLLYGFSRGAQLAHHYAMFYPTRTLGVAVFSAGAYTLPYSESKKNQALPFPIGASGLSSYLGESFDQADFAKVPFNIEVGGLDTDPAPVSRSWDNYEGTNRLIRAQTYYNMLRQLGMEAKLTVFPGAHHEVNAAMNQSAVNFFQSLLSSQA